MDCHDELVAALRPLRGEEGRVQDEATWVPGVRVSWQSLGSSQGLSGWVVSQKVDSACCCSAQARVIPAGPTQVPDGGTWSVPADGSTARPGSALGCASANPVSLLASEAPITSRIASSWVIGEVGLGFNESCCAWESIGTARARCGALDGVPVAELHHCRHRQSRNLSAFNAFAEFQSQYSLRTT